MRGAPTVERTAPRGATCQHARGGDVIDDASRQAAGEMASAFGNPSGTMRLDAEGVERRADSPSSPFEEAADVAASLPPELVELAYQFLLHLGHALSEWHGTLDEAPKMVLNHFTNDVRILLIRVLDGDGRSAARAARAIFEELVTLAEVSSDSVAAERYKMHEAVTADLLARRRPGLELLSESAGRAEGRRLRDRAKRLRPTLDAAVNKFGSTFRRNWSAGNLHDTAKRHGLADEYDGYRILSGVMHGTSGALLGTRRTVRGEVVHRLGPDFELCALAYIEGLRWVRMFLERIPSAERAPWDDIGLSDKVDALIAAYPTLFSTLREIDKRTWPEMAMPAPAAVLAFYPRGVERWYRYDPRYDTLTLADAPVPEPPNLEALRARAITYDPSLFHGRPMTAVVLHTTVQPHPGAKPFQAASIFVPKDVPAFARRFVPNPPTELLRSDGDSGGH